jgi:hypothetical protein
VKLVDLKENQDYKLRQLAGHFQSHSANPLLSYLLWLRFNTKPKFLTRGRRYGRGKASNLSPYYSSKVLESPPFRVVIGHINFKVAFPVTVNCEISFRPEHS